MCRDVIEKAKAQLEPALAQDANNKGFYRNVGYKRNIEENIPPLINKT